MGRPMKQETEARKANQRISYYLAGGSRLVYVSRAILAGILIVIWIVLWWQGLGD